MDLYTVALLIPLFLIACILGVIADQVHKLSHFVREDYTHAPEVSGLPCTASGTTTISD